MDHDDSSPGLAGSWYCQLSDSASSTPLTLPTDVIAILNNLPGVPRGSLARIMLETHGVEVHSDFRRGMVAGMILAAEQRGELSSAERAVLMEYAEGFRSQHEYP